MSRFPFSASTRSTGLCCAIFTLAGGLALTGSVQRVRAEDNAPKLEPVDAAMKTSTPLNKNGTILLDKQNQRLLLKTKLVLRQGVLEMLVCPKQTKEHESILSLDGQVKIVHAGLLALGAEPGHPVRFQPEYQPPEGKKIDIFVNWQDKQGKWHRRRSQEWIRQATHRYFEVPLAQAPPKSVTLDEGDDSLRYDTPNHLLLWYGTMSEAQKKEFLAMSENADYRKAVNQLFDESQSKQMEAQFVFVGSALVPLEDGTQLYQAEAGSAICVANFADAMIDVDIVSSASNDYLLYEPWTERLPETGTEVIVELIPVKASEAKPSEDAEPTAKPKTEPAEKAPKPEISDPPESEAKSLSAR